MRISPFKQGRYEMGINCINIYYVYAYLRKTDRTPYYIGKGKNNRAYQNHKHIPVPKDHSLIIILEQNLTEIGALAIERRMIRWYGRKNNNTGMLLNLTDGGEGSTGRITSAETRQKLSEVRKGKPGTPKSDETRKKMSKSMTGKTHSVESCQKMSNAHKNKIVSIETRQKTSNTLKGKPWSEARRLAQNNKKIQNLNTNYDKEYNYESTTI